MKQYQRTCLLFAVTIISACDKNHDDSRQAASPSESSLRPSSNASLATTTIDGVRFEFTRPADMPDAPKAYPHNAIYDSTDGIEITLLTNREPSATLEQFFRSSGAQDLEVVDRHQVGDSIVYRTQQRGAPAVDGDQYVLEAWTPNSGIGWTCMGPVDRAAEIRAMCLSVKHTRP